VLWEAQVKDGAFITSWLTPNTHSVLGIAREELIGTARWMAHVHPDDLANLKRPTPRSGNAKAETWTDQYRWVAPDGTITHLQVGVSAHPQDDGGLTLVGFALDVSEQVEAAEAVMRGLRTKETLLQEIHHRVKNNLQVISSLLAMQEDITSDPVGRVALQESINRISSMRLIHDRLYQHEMLTLVDFADYARDLVGILVRSYRANDLVKVRVDTAPCVLGVETATPTGLILNELVSNALKHGLKAAPGELYVSIQSLPPDLYRLTVRDSGPGLAGDFDLDRKASLGLKLVNSLVRQVKGTLEIDRGPGAAFSVTFKELNPVQQ
jgi:PAS domain S-box-containing protein